MFTSDVKSVKLHTSSRATLQNSATVFRSLDDRYRSFFAVHSSRLRNAKTQSIARPVESIRRQISFFRRFVEEVNSRRPVSTDMLTQLYVIYFKKATKKFLFFP